MVWDFVRGEIFILVGLVACNAKELHTNGNTVCTQLHSQLVDTVTAFLAAT